MVCKHNKGEYQNNLGVLTVKCWITKKERLLNKSICNKCVYYEEQEVE